MRLPEIDAGDDLRHRLLIAAISRFSGMRLPDAARVAFYHRDFAGPALGAWTQQAMRGPSGWSVSERELMASMVAQWLSCPFCVGAHGAIAVRGMEVALVEAVHEDYRAAPIPERLRATLVFLEKLTRSPDDLCADDVRAVLKAGVQPQELSDACAVASVFNVIAGYANALGFDIPTPDEFDKAAGMLLRRGYS
jgi:AhpD family alkylhydroperoxidase